MIISHRIVCRITAIAVRIFLRGRSILTQGGEPVIHLETVEAVKRIQDYIEKHLTEKIH
jgi:hypothetical protein